MSFLMGLGLHHSYLFYHTFKKYNDEKLTCFIISCVLADDHQL